MGWNNLSEKEQNKRIKDWLKRPVIHGGIEVRKGVNVDNLEGANLRKVEKITGHIKSRFKKPKQKPYSHLRNISDKTEDKKTQLKVRKIMDELQREIIRNRPKYTANDIKKAAPHKLIKVVGPYDFKRDKKTKKIMDETPFRVPEKDETPFQYSNKKKKKNPLSTTIAIGLGHPKRHEVPFVDQAKVINDPDEIYYGMNDRPRRVIFFIKEMGRSTLWVITEAFRPNYVITSYRPNEEGLNSVKSSLLQDVHYKKFRK